MASDQPIVRRVIGVCNTGWGTLTSGAAMNQRNATHVIQDTCSRKDHIFKDLWRQTNGGNQRKQSGKYDY